MRAINVLTDHVKRFFTEGPQRSLKAKRNIIASFLVKGGSLLISFMLVPMTIDYVSKDQYGIWLTLSSVIGWFTFFDIGLDRGLQNKFAESIAKGNKEAARIYLSSTYAILGIISLALLGIFFLINPFLNWGSILNAPTLAKELSLVSLVVFSFFCINFVLQLTQTIFRADQRPSLVGFTNMLSNLLTLGIIFLLTQFTKGSLINLALAMGLAPLIVWGIVTIYFYRKDYKEYIPAIKYVRRSHYKELMNTGFQFFMVQVLGVVIYSTDNMIVTQIFGPSEVPAYDASFRLFGVISQVGYIAYSPFWAAFTDAYHSKDFDWIWKTNKNLIKIWAVIVGASLVMLLLAQPFYDLWLKGKVEVPVSLDVFMCLYVNTLSFGGIFAMFVNGVGKVRLQIICTVIGGLANIPLSIFLAKNMGMGLSGIILASTICSFYSPIFGPIQFRKIMNGTAKGIWNK